MTDLEGSYLIDNFNKIYCFLNFFTDSYYNIDDKEKLIIGSKEPIISLHMIGKYGCKDLEEANAVVLDKAIIEELKRFEASFYLNGLKDIDYYFFDNIIELININGVISIELMYYICDIYLLFGLTNCAIELYELIDEICVKYISNNKNYNDEIFLEIYNNVLNSKMSEIYLKIIELKNKESTNEMLEYIYSIKKSIIKNNDYITYR